MRKTAHIVVVLDDEEMVRTSLKRLLETRGYSVRSHASPEEFFQSGPPELPGCLLLDQRLGKARGTDVHAEMLRRGWQLPTIFLTVDWDAHTVVEAMRNGADNYLTKPYDPDELLAAVEAACQRCLDAREREAELESLRARARLLTPRERTIVSLVANGLLNKEIADQLGLALITVKLHRGRAMKKLGAQNVADLARIVLRLGL